ncbi:MAG: ATP-binding protein [Clostridiaceae bacterium]|nr:ATP-binding protein [Clostridiaceae bacterium]
MLNDIGLKSYTLEYQWCEHFSDPTIADAIMDRIIHNSYILELDSKLS